MQGIEVTTLPFLQKNADSTRFLNDSYPAGSWDTPYQYVQWLALHKEIKEASFEVSIDTDIRIRFWVPKQADAKDLDLLCTALQTSQTHLEFDVTPDAAIFEIFGTSHNKRLVNKDTAKFGDQALSIILIKGIPGSSIVGTHIDKLIQAIIDKEIQASFVVHFRSSKKIPKSHHEEIDSIDSKGQNWHLSPPQEQLLQEEETAYGFWEISAYLVIRSKDQRSHLSKVRRARIILETIFLNPNRPIETKVLKGCRLKLALTKIAYRKKIGKTGLLSSRQLSHLVHFPQEAQPGYVRRHSPAFELPPHRQTEVELFQVMKGNRTLYQTGIDLSHLTTHMVVVGQTGKGKTRFVGSLIQQIKDLTDIGITVFDWKGEYTGLMPTVYEIGVETCPLKINLFETHGLANVEQYVQNLVALFRELLRSDVESSLSSQMERVLRESLIEYLKNGSGNYEEYEEFLTNWIKQNSRRFSNPESSTAGLINRFGTLFRGRLGYIFNTPITTINFDSLLKDQVCFNLSQLAAYNKEDARLFLNALIMVIRSYLLQRFSKHLRYLVIAEEAHYLVPEVFTKRSSAEASPIEDIALFQRAYGAGLIAVTTRPNLISRNILANSGTKIFFQCPLDAQLVGDVLNLTQEQRQFLRLMPDRIIIAHLPWFEHPFKAKTFDFSPLDRKATNPHSSPSINQMAQCNDMGGVASTRNKVSSLTPLERHFLDKVCTVLYKKQTLHRICRINGLVVIDIPRLQMISIFVEKYSQLHQVEFDTLSSTYSSIILICPPSIKPRIHAFLHQELQSQPNPTSVKIYASSLTRAEIQTVLAQVMNSRSTNPSQKHPVTTQIERAT